METSTNQYFTASAPPPSLLPFYHHHDHHATPCSFCHPSCTADTHPAALSPLISEHETTRSGIDAVQENYSFCWQPCARHFSVGNNIQWTVTTTKAARARASVYVCLYVRAHRHVRVCVFVCVCVRVRVCVCVCVWERENSKLLNNIPSDNDTLTC